MRNVLSFCLVLTLSVSCGAQKAEKLAPLDFKNSIENETKSFKILDLRTNEEVAEGMVPKAEQLDFFDENFEFLLEALNRETTYYIYCKSGGRSGKTFEKMKELGFKNVYELQGGMNAWMAEGLKTE